MLDGNGTILAAFAGRDVGATDTGATGRFELEGQCGNVDARYFSSPER